MKLLYPKTKREDAEAYLLELAELNKALAEGKIDEGRFMRGLYDIDTRYKGKIDPSDIHLFESEEDYVSFLKSIFDDTPQGRKEMHYALSHEKEHFEAARKNPNVNSKYGFWLVLNGENVNGIPFVEIIAKNAKDYRNARKESLDAVNEASPLDKLESE